MAPGGQAGSCAAVWRDAGHRLGLSQRSRARRSSCGLGGACAELPSGVGVSRRCVEAKCDSSVVFLLIGACWEGEAPAEPIAARPGDMNGAMTDERPSERRRPSHGVVFLDGWPTVIFDTVYRNCAGINTDDTYQRLGWSLALPILMPVHNARTSRTTLGTCQPASASSADASLAFYSEASKPKAIQVSFLSINSVPGGRGSSRADRLLDQVT